MKERSELGSLVSGKSAKDQNDGPWNLGFPPYSFHSFMFSLFSCAYKYPEMFNTYGSSDILVADL
jgi:hypothetical protein